jgi:proteasome lid subunit RPN8/RPN11
MINIDAIAHDLMIKDAIDSFPDECCGFFYGEEDEDGNRIVKEILMVNNSKEGDKKKRFEISARDYIRGEDFAAKKNLSFLGVYHSHPNHPAIPSEHDRIAAQPYFSYIIISVINGDEIQLRSWRLNDSFQFEEELVNQNESSIIK